MAIVVVVVIVAGVLSLAIGLLTISMTTFSRRGAKKPVVVQSDESTKSTVVKVVVKEQDSILTTNDACWTLASWLVGLGVFLMISPDWFFGPSWSYFNYIPHNGFYMGVCCVGLGLAEMVTLLRKRENQYRILSNLFFLSGFVFWTAGIILGAEGLRSHEGLIEAPLLMFAGAFKYVLGVSLSVLYRQDNPSKSVWQRTFRRHR